MTLGDRFVVPETASMIRLAHSDRRTIQPEPYAELADKRALIINADLGLGSLAAHAFAAQDCRLSLQANDGCEAVADELSDAPEGLRVFNGALHDAAAAERFADSALRSTGTFDAVIVNLDLTAVGLSRALKGSDDIALVFEPGFAVMERVAARMAATNGGTLLTCAHVDAADGMGHALAMLGRGSLGAIVQAQAAAWDEMGVAAGALTVADLDDDDAALTASQMMLEFAAGRSPWHVGQVLSL